MQFRRAILFVALSQAALAAAGAPEGFNVQVMPDGVFKPFSADDPRQKTWTLDAYAASAVIAEFNARKNDLVVDYEHQTLLAEENGQPAPAAGWIESLTYLPGKGLFAKVKWTNRAKAHIDAEEYRYISPVFLSDKETGHVTSLMHVALTNAPALDGMAPVALSRLLDDGKPSSPSNQPTGANMDLLVALRVALGLPETATAESALTAVSTLKAKVDGHTSEVSALKAAAFDPTKHVPIADHKKVNDELVALRKQGSDTEVTALVDGAIKDRRLTPAQKDWATKLGQGDLTALKDFLKDAPEVVPGTTQSGGKGAAGGSGEETAEAIALKAQTYVAEQAKLGRTVGSAEAVAHVTSKKG